MRRGSVWFGLLALLLSLFFTVSLWAAPQQQQTDDVVERIAQIKSRTPTVTDHFRQDEGRWNLESDADMARFYQASTLHVNIFAPQTVGWSVAEITAGDFYLEVDAFHVGGPLDNEYGVLFRYVDAENFYRFGASHDGYYSLQMMADGEWVDLVEWTESELLNTGEGAGNTLGVWAEGDQITILLNGEALATVTDSTFSTGRIALMAGTFDDGGVEIAFDDLFLWALSAPSPPEPTAEDTATPTPTSAPSTVGDSGTFDPEAIAERLAAIRMTDPVVSDDFRRDEDLWPTTSDEYVAYSYVRRTYRITVKTPNWLGFAFNRDSEEQPLSSFLAEVDVAQVAGPLDAEYGLIFHHKDSDNFFLYAVSGAGTYSLWKKVDGNWTALINWTDTEALDISEEATNSLALLVEGEQITLLVNDIVVAQYTEEAPFTGAVGLMAGTFDEPGVEIAFDNFNLWPVAAAESEPEPTPALIATPEPVDVSARLAEIRSDAPTFSDDFRRNDGTWSTVTDDHAVLAYVGRTYQVTVNSTNWLSWSFPELAHGEMVADLLAEVDVERMAGPANGEYGLLFRYVDQENFYLFAISGLQTYSLWKKVNDEWQAIIDWTSTTAIANEEGSINRLAVLAEGDQITLLVNNNAIAQVTDDSFAAGSVGLAAGTFDEDQLAVAFDNFDLWVLGESEAATPAPALATLDSAAIAGQIAAIRQTEPMFADDFRRNTGIWLDPEDNDATFAFAAGAYRVTVDAPHIIPGSTGDITVDNFLLEVDAAQRSGPGGQYGLSFRRVDDANFYLYAITPTGLYSFGKMVEGEWRELITWTESDAILQGEGEVNRLGVLADGAIFTLLVNDQPVAQFEDGSFASGQIALTAGAFDETGVEVEFDNLAIWTLE